jgi:predicted ferric reductase
MKQFLKILFPVLGAALLMWVLSVSINNNGGLYATFHGTSTVVSYNIFRLAALAAFVLMSFQIITGPYMHLWNKLYGKDSFYFFHSYEGIFVLVFALLHFGFIHLFMHLQSLSLTQFSALYREPYITFGPVVLALLAVTSITAIIAVLFLHQKPRRWWRYFHYANYVVYLLAFFHSMNVGSDLHQGSPLRPLWYIFFILFIFGFIYKRIIRVIQKRDEVTA